MIATSWTLIVLGIVGVLVAQIAGKDSMDMGWGVSLNAELPWVQPVTWVGVAVAVIGVAILPTSQGRATTGGSDSGGAASPSR